MMSKVQTITTPNGEKLAVLPFNDYRAMLDAIEAAEALAAAGAAARGEAETLSQEETAALIEAATPLAFWRGKRGLTQGELAAAAGISQSYVAGLETGSRKGDPALFLRLARVLKTPMEAIVSDEA